MWNGLCNACNIDAVTFDIEFINMSSKYGLYNPYNTDFVLHAIWTLYCM